MYDLRSATEHLNSPDDAVPRLFQPDDAPARTRVYQAHEVARWLYRRILQEPSLLPHFETDDSIRALQELDPREKRRLFGKPPHFEGLQLRGK